MTVRRAADLYGLPLEEFTGARDELARELRRAGKKEAADEVKALRKPSVSAWAVNQAVRRRPEAAKALVDAGAELRKAQRSVISGKEPAALRDAARAHRERVDELTEAARAALEARGAVTPAVIVRVSQTLRSASVDKEAAKALSSGRLTEDVEQSGFGPLLTAVPARRDRRPATKPPPKPKQPKPKPDPNRAQRERLRRQLEKAQQRVRELEEALRALDARPR